MKIFENEARVKAYIRATENWYFSEIEKRKELLAFYGIEWGEVEELVKEYESNAKKYAERIYEDWRNQNEITDEDLKDVAEIYRWTEDDWKQSERIEHLKIALLKAIKEGLVIDFCHIRYQTGKPLPSISKEKDSKREDFFKLMQEWMLAHKDESVDTLKRSYGIPIEFLIGTEERKNIPSWVEQILCETALARYHIEIAENVGGLIYLETSRKCPSSGDINRLKRKGLDKMKWDGMTFKKPVGRKKRGEDEKTKRITQWIAEHLDELSLGRTTRERNTAIMEKLPEDLGIITTDKTCEKYVRFVTEEKNNFLRK